jgi:hypothetical protein
MEIEIWVLDSECCDTCGALLDSFESVLCTDCLRDAWYNEEQTRYEVCDEGEDETR